MGSAPLIGWLGLLVYSLDLHHSSHEVLRRRQRPCDCDRALGGVENHRMEEDRSAQKLQVCDADEHGQHDCFARTQPGPFC